MAVRRTVMEAVCTEPKVFVGQIPPDATQASIQELFAVYGTIKRCQLITNPEGKSKGCAMVLYERWAYAEDAINALNGSFPLGGDRALVVKFADPPKKSADGGPPVGVAPKKLFVGQVPKELTEQEIRVMFGAHGTLTDVHMFRKPGNSTGCAFVTFSTWREAEEALEAINGSCTLQGMKTPIVVKFADAKVGADGAAIGGQKRGFGEDAGPRAGGPNKRAFLGGDGPGGPGGFGMNSMGMNPGMMGMGFGNMMGMGMNPAMAGMGMGMAPNGMNMGFGMPGMGMGMNPAMAGMGMGMGPMGMGGFGGMQPGGMGMQGPGMGMQQGGAGGGGPGAHGGPGGGVVDGLGHFDGGMSQGPGGMMQPQPQMMMMGGPGMMGGGRGPGMMGNGMAPIMLNGNMGGAMKAGGGPVLMGGGGAGGGGGGAHVPEEAKAWKLFVGQVPFEAGEGDLMPFFASCGAILDLVVLRASGRSKGCAFVTYASRDQAELAIQNLNGSKLPNDMRGKGLLVKYANQRP